jgi:hypothetical protein
VSTNMKWGENLAEAAAAEMDDAEEEEVKK